MTDDGSSLWYALHREQPSLRAPIIAGLTTDEGASIMCADCGHIFAPSKPLSDESEPIDNVTLARALYYHSCATGRKDARGGDRRGR